MAVTDLTFETPTDADWETLVCFMRAFCEEDGHPYGPGNERALKVLLDTPLHGRVVLLRHRGAAAGYAALCYGFSLEFNGRDAFLDEIYVDPAFRGLGIGSRALERLKEIAIADGIVALHLEVMEENAGAARLYERTGFHRRPTRLMTCRLEPDAAA